MTQKFKKWWKALSFNEKMMYTLMLMLTIGILTRVKFIGNEIAEAFGVYFGGGAQ